MKKTRLKSSSAKQNIAKKEYKKTFDELKDRGVFEKCSSCGQNQMISPSHLVRRSLRKDLEAVHINITGHCMERMTSDEFKTRGCHDRWESKDWKQLLTLMDLDKLLVRVRELDESEYNAFMILKEDYNEKMYNM